ncbi:MAG: hypothetical protein NZZ41_05105 [Candidatus Dojkabacteria bacterium]|nr:hypothetical protein [Candidatus Dojkabacteria bacterium]
MLKYAFKYFCIVFVLVLCAVSQNTVIAEPYNDYIQKANVNIITDFTVTKVEYLFEIINLHNVNLLKEINIVLPFANIADLQVFRNNLEANYVLNHKDIFTELIINLTPDLLRSYEKLLIKISFTTTDIVYVVGNFNILKVDIKYKFKINYSIFVPKEFNNPLYSNVKYSTSADAHFNIFSFSTSYGFYFVFGSQHDLEIGLILSLIDDTTHNNNNLNRINDYFLLNVLPISSFQNYSYNLFTFPDGSIALSDHLGNNYIALPMKLESSVSTEWRAKVYGNSYNTEFFKKLSKVDYSNLLNDNVNDYVVSLNEVLTKYDASNELAYLSSIYDFLISGYDISFDSIFSTNNNYFIKENLNKKKLTQIEFCLIMYEMHNNISKYNNSNSKLFMLYGYLKIPEVIGLEFGQPHLWCELVQDGVRYIFDPLLQQKTGFIFNGSKNIDRIAFGIWNPHNLYDPVLGLRNNSYKQTIFRVTSTPHTDMVTKINKDIIVSINLDDMSSNQARYITVINNTTHQFSLNVENQNSIILPVISIALSNNTNNLVAKLPLVSNYFYYALKPFERKNFIVNFNISLDFFFEGKTTYYFHLESLESFNNFSESFDLYVKPNYIVISFIVLILLTTGFLIIIMLLYFVLLKKFFRYIKTNKK